MIDDTVPMTNTMDSAAGTNEQNGQTQIIYEEDVEVKGHNAANTMDSAAATNDQNGQTQIVYEEDVEVMEHGAANTMDFFVEVMEHNVDDENDVDNANFEGQTDRMMDSLSPSPQTVGMPEHELQTTMSRAGMKVVVDYIEKELGNGNLPSPGSPSNL